MEERMDYGMAAEKKKAKRRGRRVFWIVCAILFVIGGILFLTGIIMGARPSQIAQLMNGGVYVNEEGLNIGGWHFGKDSDITPAEADEPEDGILAQSYDGVSTLKINVTGATLEILPSVDESVQVEASGDEDLSRYGYTCDQEDATLTIKSKTLTDLNVEDHLAIRVYMPEYMPKIKIVNKAGTIYIESVAADTIDLDVGAGQAQVNHFQAEKLTLSCGAGEVTATGDVTKNLDVDCGLGSVSLALESPESAYNYTVSCGVGEVNIGGKSYSGLGQDVKVKTSGAERKLDISCGVGEVNVSFTE